MKVLAIDPGDKQSAFVVFDNGRVVVKDKVDNEQMMRIIKNPITHIGAYGAAIDYIAIEMIASYGMAVGREVFETCVWIGRFQEASIRPVAKVYRKDIKLHLCNHPRANDSNIRAALIDRFGGKQKAIGNKKNPGPLYGVAKDMWAALAIAVYFQDQQKVAA